jgi:SAM-dependent methyltransferase
MSNAPDPITEALREAPGGRVLDLATGRGIFLETLLGTLDGVEMAVGVDSDARATAAAKAAVADLDERVLIAQMDTRALGFAESAFDTVGIANSLHHLADLDATFAEIRRVVRRGGRCIVSEMFRDDQSPAQQTHVQLHHWAAAIDRARGIIHRETYTLDELLDLVDRLGLEDLDIFTYAATDEDPRDPEMVEHLSANIDRIVEGASGAPDEAALRQQAAELKARVHEVGYHPATQLIAIGRSA